MINPSIEMAKMMKIMEAGYMGKADGSDIDYKTSPKGDKITATVTGHLSAKYTKLGQNIDEINALQARIDELNKQTKQDAREAISDLFTAEDEVRTRVVETRSFTLKLTKTPEPTKTTKYAAVIDDLLKLQPELITVLETLIEKHSSVVQKSAALSFAPKESIDLSEGPLDKLRAFFAKFLSYIDSWCSKYDSKLGALQAKAGFSESIEEDEDAAAGGVFTVTKIINSALKDHGINILSSKPYEGVITVGTATQTFTINIEKNF